VPGDVVVCTNDAVVLHMSPQVAAGMFYLVDSKVISRNNPNPNFFRLCFFSAPLLSVDSTAPAQPLAFYVIDLLCPCCANAQFFGVQEKALVVR
jgi:hypothetical protein